MPIPLGVLAVAGAGAGPSAGAAYELLETQVLTSTSDSVAFTNINTNYASTYKHLQIRMVTKNNISVAWNHVTINSSSNSHRMHYLRGSGSAVSSSTISDTKAYYAVMSNAYWGANVMDILDAFSTNKNKVLRGIGGVDTGADGLFFYSGLAVTTSAVSSLTFTLDGGNSFAIGSRFSLYGLRSV